MVQLNKDERVWVCSEMARVQTAHAVQRLWPNRWPVRRVPIPSMRYSRITENTGSMALAQIKINKQWEISLVFSYIVIKGEIKDKMTYRPCRRQGNQNNTTVSQLNKCIKIMTFWEVCFEIPS